MVITSRILQDRLGIDSEIAGFFANERKVPVNNLFWQNKRIYLSVGFGFLTIPFAFDLMYKRGLSKDVLLDDNHISLMEEGFDRLKRFEANKSDLASFVQECALLLQDKVKQQHLAADLFGFFSGASPQYFQFEAKHKALARSDFFLLTLVDLDVTDEWIHEFLPYWYSIARPILLLDDFKDLEYDRMHQEENTIIELGNDAPAVEAAYAMGLADLSRLATVNPKLAKFLETLLKEALEHPYIRNLLD